MSKDHVPPAPRTAEEVDRLRQSLHGFLDLVAGAVAERLRKNQDVRPRRRRNPTRTLPVPFRADQSP
jgi:hypothetical protein